MAKAGRMVNNTKPVSRKTEECNGSLQIKHRMKTRNSKSVGVESKSVVSERNKRGSVAVEKEVANIIETGTTIGFDFKDVGKEVIKAIMRRELVTKYNPVVLFLQETKLGSFDSGVIRSLGGSFLTRWIGVAAEGASSGLITQWNKDFFCVNSCISSNRTIILEGELTRIKKKMVFCNIYAANVENERKELWDLIIQEHNSFLSPWCICGDFNTVLEPVERAKVVDISMHVMPFTWSNNREKASWERLDRFLIYPKIVCWFPNLIQKGLPRSLSDHNTVMIGEEKDERGSTPFRFVNSWLHENGLMKEAMVGWKKSMNGRLKGGSLAAKVKESKCHIKRWLRENKKEIPESKKLEEGLVEVDKKAKREGWTIQLRKERLFFLSKLWEGFRRKEQLWRQKSRIKGLNIKRISDSENSFLEGIFNREEVRAAIVSCDGNKAPCPDGLNLNFIKANWEVIQEDFMKFIHEFHKNGSIVKDLNHTFIALIPKCVHPETIKDFRPISLVGSMYKIFAKVLANRLKKVMDSVISENQIAFIQSRQIMDSFVVAEEIIHSWRKDKERGLLVKLDFEKAYDSVDHSFLDFVLEDMGFGTRWRNCVRCCVATLSMSVLVNGSPTSEFGVERDLKGIRWLSNVDSSDSYFVKVVASLFKEGSISMKILDEGLQIVVGNGESVSFWNDAWCDSISLKDRYPRIYALATKKLGFIKEFGSWQEDRWVWKVQMRRRLFDWELDVWSSFNANIDRARQDGLWECESVWNGFSPPKVEIFMWQLVRGRLMVRDLLNHFGVLVNAGMNCPLCNRHIETIDHLFLLCSWARELWYLCMRWWGVIYCPNRNFPEWFQGWKGLCPSVKYRRVWVTMFSAIAWSIWEARNHVLFKGISADITHFVDLIRFRVAWWFKHYGKGSSEPITVILENLKTCCVDAKPVRFSVKKAWIPPSAMDLKFNACVICVSKPSFVGKNSSLSSESSVSWVNDKDFGNLCLLEMIVDIRSMLRFLGNTTVNHCSRDSNDVADNLAKKGSLMEGEVVEWREP
ncbi:hypothetical protein Dsin_023375 [Dipteronia sinensis]|uniref:Reverse transcriptase domain-containing protein n=1 Tax=Dipteronia sinensis TaxID=43782 RepID=A0AAE0E0M0_9ROSI|nr:hypothetical protein Dsin_023375 [Dipteronia sinensis]